MKDWPTTMQVSYPVFWVEERRYRHTLAGPSGSLAMHDLVTIWLVTVDRSRCMIWLQFGWSQWIAGDALYLVTIWLVL